MNFKEANQFLESLINYEKKTPKGDFDFERFKVNLKEFGNPHLELKNPVIITGTKGKGSTAHHIVAGLLSKGINNCGLFTSPHILDVRERIRTGFEKISENDFVKYVLKIKEKIEKGLKLTYFESLTIMGFLYFKDKKTEYNILEVGLGGRLDSVNVCPSEFSIITPISYDHEHVLGNTIEKIAWEKSFVIKGKYSIIAPQPQEALNVLLERAKKVKSETLILSHNVPFKIIETNRDGTFFKVFFENRWHHIKTPKLGDFQAINAALSFLYLKLNGFEVFDFKNIEIEGRLDVINKEPLFIADGAHNPLSIRAVVRNIKKIFKKNAEIIIFGTNRDKKFSKMLEILKELEPDIIILTQSNVPRRISPEILENEAKRIGFKKTQRFENAFDAIDFSLKNSFRNTLILLTGSFYLVELAKRYFL